MNTQNIIEDLELTKNRLLLALPQKLRPFHQELAIADTRALFIFGPRGTGKTTFLLNSIRGANFLYLSADNPTLASLPLYEFVSSAFKQGFQGVVVDEIHFANNWSTHLKALYDDFPDKFIRVSDSSSLVLRKGAADLSRRFVSWRMPLLSFREYLFLRMDRLLTPIDIFSFDPGFLRQVQDLNILKLFREYLAEGIRPFFLEGEYCKRLEGILQKTLYADIPFYVPSIQDRHLRLMNAVVGHLLQSSVPTVNMAGMCSEWAISKEKLYDLLHVMDQCELLRLIHKPHGKKKYSKGAKMFFADPSFYYCFKGEIGNAREAFAAFTLSEKHEVFAAPNEAECDYLIDGRKIEIGGRSKKRKAADLVLRDDIDLPVGDSLPLWMAGMVY